MKPKQLSPQQEIIVSTLRDFRIPLTQGKYALVSEQDYAELSEYKWHLHRKKNRGDKHYFRACRMEIRDGRRTVIPMHRQIMGFPGGKVVDHINGDSLDNRRENLRILSNADNVRHRVGGTKNKHGVRGIGQHKSVGRTRRWFGQIRVNGENLHTGYFASKDEALDAYERLIEKRRIVV